VRPPGASEPGHSTEGPILEIFTLAAWAAARPRRGTTRPRPMRLQRDVRMRFDDY